MTAGQIKKRLREKKLLQKELARRFKVSPTALSLFIAGKITSARLERRLARTLGVSVEEFRGEGSAA